MSKQGKLKLNLGCGNNKIDGCVNIDIEKSVKPDFIWDFKAGLPFPDGFVDEINFFHVIEHIEEKFHQGLLKEFWRVLKPAGKIYISYPEFVVCAKNYIANHLGKRDFWKATIFGRQHYSADYHVSLMDSRNFYLALDNAGFGNILVVEESKQEPHNTIVFASKVKSKFTYEDALNVHCFGHEMRVE